jgi:hypothetical protein
MSAAPHAVGQLAVIVVIAAVVSQLYPSSKGAAAATGPVVPRGSVGAWATLGASTVITGGADGAATADGRTAVPAPIRTVVWGSNESFVDAMLGDTLNLPSVFKDAGTVLEQWRATQVGNTPEKLSKMDKMRLNNVKFQPDSRVFYYHQEPRKKYPTAPLYQFVEATMAQMFPSLSNGTGYRARSIPASTDPASFLHLPERIKTLMQPAKHAVHNVKQMWWFSDAGLTSWAHYDMRCGEVLCCAERCWRGAGEVLRRAAWAPVRVWIWVGWQ